MPGQLPGGQMSESVGSGTEWGPAPERLPKNLHVNERVGVRRPAIRVTSAKCGLWTF